MPSEGGRPLQVTQRGGTVPEESFDGRFLYYSKYLQPDAGSGVSLWRMPTGGGEETLVAESLANYSTYAVAKTGVYFLTTDPAGSGYVPEIARQRLQYRGLRVEVTLLDRALSHLSNGNRAVVGDALARGLRQGASRLRNWIFFGFSKGTLRLCSARSNTRHSASTARPPTTTSPDALHAF